MYHKKALWLTIPVSLVLQLALPLLSACGSQPDEAPETPVAPTTPATTPTTPVVAEKSEFDIVQAAADAYMTSGSKWNIKASDLYLQLNDDDAANDPYVISARKPDVYALGHVPVAADTFEYYGQNLLPDFDSLPTWKYATPHNIQLKTPQNASCGACHNNPAFFLTEDDVSPSERAANQPVIVVDPGP